MAAPSVNFLLQPTAFAPPVLLLASQALLLLFLSTLRSNGPTCTALLRALEARRASLFQALLDVGADPLLVDDNGRDCFFHATAAHTAAVTFTRAHSSITLSADGAEAKGSELKTAVSGAVMRSGRHFAEFTWDGDGDVMPGVIGAGFDVDCAPLAP